MGTHLMYVLTHWVGRLEDEFHSNTSVVCRQIGHHYLPGIAYVVRHHTAQCLDALELKLYIYMVAV